jgi:hypothetical protein
MDRYREHINLKLNELRALCQSYDDKLIVEFINRRERQILVHSYIYEDLNKNLIDDATWDLWAKELVFLFDEYRELAKESVYYKHFIGWTGDTASDLQEAYRLPEIMDTARRLLEQQGDC